MSTDEKKKILLVDDDTDLLEQTKIQIENNGYTVVTAENGEEGWKIYKTEKPDAALIDLMMEEYDSGFILSYKIKKDKPGKNIPVIILTSATFNTGFKFGTSTDEEREWIKCDEIMNKPVVIEELVEKLDGYLMEKAN